MAPSKNTEVFNREVAEGFFDEPRSLSDVIGRFHEHGLLVHKGVVSPLLLKAVRNGTLRRKKVESEGKKVWAYERED